MAKVDAPPHSIKEHYSYNPITGEFKNNRTGNTTRPSHSEGYHRVQYRGVRYFVHRLAYWWLTNEWPEEVDHKNRDTSDNRFINLRKATQQQNSCNKSTRGKSIYRGITWYKKNKKWGVTLRKNGKAYYIGLYNSEYEAAVVYNKAAKELHEDFAAYNDVFKNA